MSKRLNRPVSAMELGRRLGLELLGSDREIREVCGLDQLQPHSLSFVRDKKPAPGAAGTVLAAAPQGQAQLTVLRSERPRFDFIRAQHLLFASPGFAAEAEPPKVHPSAHVASSAVLEAGVSVGEGSWIGERVVVRAGTRIGRFCEIDAGTVLGATGFGFERDEEDRPLRMLQFGGLVIGDHVEIGPLSQICRGALGDAVIEDDVKIDGLVHIGHNCHIGSGAIITACCMVSGSVRIGRNVWLAPNCVVMQKVRLGDGCQVGIGAVVLGDVEAGVTVFGNPARPLAFPKAASAA